MTTQTVGFIGTGLMGRGMARSLIRKGHRVRLYNRTRAKAEEVAEIGGTVVDSPAEAVRGADVVVTMLADPGALLAVVEGERGVCAAIRAGAVVVDSSTVSPPTTLRVRELLAERGAEMLDAPVFGSKHEAETGALGLIVGGERDVIARAQPVLDAMGRTIHVGGNGMGAYAKLVVNLVIAGTLQAFNEGMVVAAKAGLDTEVMLSVLLSSRARSGIIEMKAPQVLKRDFTPFFPLQLMAKDMRLVRESAAALELTLPLVETLSRVYEACLAAGLGGEDYCATIKPLEAQAGVAVAKAASVANNGGAVK